MRSPPPASGRTASAGRPGGSGVEYVGSDVRVDLPAKSIGVLISGRAAICRRNRRRGDAGCMRALPSHLESPCGAWTDRARAAGIETLVIDHKGFPDARTSMGLVAALARARGVGPLPRRLHAADCPRCSTRFHRHSQHSPVAAAGISGVDAQRRGARAGVKTPVRPSTSSRRPRWRSDRCPGRGARPRR